MRQRTLFIVFGLAAALVLVLSACAPAAAPPASPGESSAPVGEQAAGKSDFYFVYVPKLVHPWYEDVKKGADLAAQRRGWPSRASR